MKLRTNNIFPRKLPPNIIFDLGGVLIDIDPSLWENALRSKLGEKPYFKYRRLAASEGLLEQFEMGIAMPHEVRDFFRQPGTSFSNYEFDLMWNKTLLDIPSPRIRILLKLKKMHRLYMLSNTNILHMASINLKLKKHHQHSSFEWLFDDLFLSYETGFLKPEPKAYLNILKKHNLTAEETLFIDDSAENIVAAENLGMQTFHLKADEGQRIEDYFPECL